MLSSKAHQQDLLGGPLGAAATSGRSQPAKERCCFAAIFSSPSALAARMIQQGETRHVQRVDELASFQSLCFCSRSVTHRGAHHQHLTKFTVLFFGLFFLSSSTHVPFHLARYGKLVVFLPSQADRIIVGSLSQSIRLTSLRFTKSNLHM